MKPGSKPPPSIDLVSIIIGGGLGLLTIFVPLLSVLGNSNYDNSPNNIGRFDKNK